MSGRSSQRKGRAAELELCRLLNARGIPAMPGAALNYGTEPDITGVDGFHVEVKRHERIEIAAWMAQAERDAQRFGDGWPCVFHRRSREPWCVTMPLDAFLMLYVREDAGCTATKHGSARSFSQMTDTETGGE